MIYFFQVPNKKIIALANLGQALLELGEYDAAALSLYQSKELSQQSGHIAGITISLVQISRLHRFRNNDIEAIKTLNTLLENEAAQGFPEFGF